MTDHLKTGSLIDATVTNLVSFGVFLEAYDGQSLFVHISEISWGHVNHPAERIAVGDPVPVRILQSTHNGHREASIKRVHESPFERFARHFEVGELVDGTVKAKTTFGVFIEIAEGLEGLVHISEMGQEEDSYEAVRPGDHITVKVIEIDRERPGISLSVKQVNSAQGPLRNEATVTS